MSQPPSPWSFLKGLLSGSAPLKPVSAEDLKEWMRTGDTMLVDVREPEEFSREHMVGAVSVPLSGFPSKLNPPDTARRVVFLCQSGTRTRFAAGRLAASSELPGFALSGGLNEWNRLR